MFSAALEAVDEATDRGPWFGTMTTDLTPVGPVIPGAKRYTDIESRPGRSAQGGISRYIDQDVGGVVQPRVDASAGPLGGIISRAMKFGRFNGDTIGTTTIVPNRVQGEVGRSRKSTVIQRASSARSTNVPDSERVALAFTNPVASRTLAVLRGGA